MRAYTWFGAFYGLAAMFLAIVVVTSASTAARADSGSGSSPDCQPTISDVMSLVYCVVGLSSCDGLGPCAQEPGSSFCGEGTVWDADASLCVANPCVDTGVTCGPDTVLSEDGSECVCEVPTPSVDATCDGVDDDMDDMTDEDYVPLATACGLGVCAAVGMTACVDGMVEDTCVPGVPPGFTDQTCDGIDNDCDGMVDEDYVSVTTFCGQGACTSTGHTVCVDGQMLDTCLPGDPWWSDADCDGIDADCDGMVDEHYVSEMTSCGVGECASVGHTVCVDGQMLDTCLPGDPWGDETCDGIDNDCDGMADEHYVSEMTSCGVGACASVGMTYCVAGMVVDSCSPAASSGAMDETCDGIDNDCDGMTDEDYENTIASCGVGVCESLGVVYCIGGFLIDSCVPGAPIWDVDNDCDGVDDDCDGEVDEDC